MAGSIRTNVLGLAIRMAALVAMVTLLSVPLQAAPRYYYMVDHNQIELTARRNVISVGFMAGISDAQKEEISARFTVLSDPSRWINFRKVGVTQIPFKAEAPLSLIESTVSALRSIPQVEWANPTFEINGLMYIVTDRFIVKFLPDLARGVISTLNEKQGVELVKETDWAPNTFILRTTKANGASALEMANFYNNLPQVLYAEPDFVVQVKPVTNDTYYSMQWFLDNPGGYPYYGTPDADIDAPEAWAVTTGNPNIVVAIVDNGLQIAHPDLNDHVALGYDAVDGDNDPTPDGWDGHGTSCSGLAAAETNNALGVAGVGYNCHVMGCRIFYSEYSGGPLIGYSSWTVDGINYARDHADVMSCSWTMGSPNSSVTSAFNSARASGRGGLGSIICCATGNDNLNNVGYPAELASTIGVGATNEDDDRCDPADWGGGQGSNYGAEVDVVAPGKWLATTDYTGSGGYSGSDYTIAGNMGTFGGTSGATPIVAGVAALVLSVNPGLTADQVQGILEHTADDMVGDPLEDTAGWDQYMGWGRVNAFGAVDSANANNFPPPQNLNAGDGYDGHVPLNWDPPSRTLGYYRIYRSATSSSGPYDLLDSTSSTSYDDYAVVNGTTYWYKLKAIYTSPDGESDFSNIDSATPVAPVFDPPQNLIATTGLDALVILNWQPPARTLSYYRIYRSETGEFGTYVVLDSTVVIHYEDSDVINGNSYWYKLKAVYTDPNGESVFSNAAEGRPGLPNQPPVIVHDSMHDSDLPTPTLTAVVTDDYSGSPTVFLYYRQGIGGFTPLPMTSTGTPDQFMGTLPPMTQGTVDYYISAADDSGATSYDPAGAPDEWLSFDIGDIAGDELAYDDGGWEYTTYTQDANEEWAVKFTPTAYPFYLKGAEISVGHGWPDMVHQKIVVTVYDDDGPDYLPQTVLWGPDTTGSIGNEVGTMVALDRNVAYWAPVVIRDNLGMPILIENGDFYVSASNLDHYPREAFNRDSSGWVESLGGRSYFYDACEEGWYSEDDTLANPNARRSNRMIRAMGGTLAQVSDLWIEREDANIRLTWPDNGSPFYSIYADSMSSGNFNNQVAVLPDTTWIDVGATMIESHRYYQVRGSLYGSWGN
jgi:thermitase